MSLSTRQLRTLIHDTLTTTLAHDATTLPASMIYTTGHRPALFTDTSVVRGAPGTGKTLWARILTDPALRTVAAHDFQMPRLTTTRVVCGHSPVTGGGQPTQRDLADATGDGIAPVTMWTAVALTALGIPDLIRLPSWYHRALWLLRNPDVPRQAVSDLASRPGSGTTTHLIVFDALDQLHPDQRTADHLASGVLQLAADLTRLGTRVRAKVFIRPDILNAALWALTPADRNALRTAELEWSKPDYLGRATATTLYGLLFHLLANHHSKDAAAFRALTPGWQPAPDGRFTAPEPLVSDPKAQERFFNAIADPYMGGTPRQGVTYRFLPSRLLDGTGALSPRPFLAALSQAVRHAMDDHPDHPRALHHEDVRRGWPQGARARAAEVEQAMPWLRAALTPLAGQRLPIDPRDVCTLWDRAGLPEQLRQHGARAADPHPSGMRHLPRYADLMEELTAAGVLRRTTTGLFDLAEPFRVTYRLGRHGGVKPPVPAG